MKLNNICLWPPLREVRNGSRPAHETDTANWSSKGQTNASHMRPGARKSIPQWVAVPTIKDEGLSVLWIVTGFLNVAIMFYLQALAGITQASLQ